MQSTVESNFDRIIPAFGEQDYRMGSICAKVDDHSVSVEVCDNADGVGNPDGLFKMPVSRKRKVDAGLGLFLLPGRF